MVIRIPKDWEIPESEATPEHAYWNRRKIIAAAGLLGAQHLMGATGPYPAKRNPAYTLDRPITSEEAATSYTNFYEFESADKVAVKKKTGDFVTDPWRIEVTGLVNKPRAFTVDELLRLMPIEERLYRFRCVEAWAMAIPWTGFQFSELIKMVDPKPEAKFVRFVTAKRPKQMPGMLETAWYPWPYTEGLRMDEARNPLTLVATGMYGKPLPKQNGAPVRMVVPWKYGFKSIKSIVKIEFVARQPKTFWNTVAPSEYGFYANVDPGKSHPRWSQAYETFIPTLKRRETLPYNGYAKFVAGLYNGKEW